MEYQQKGSLQENNLGVPSTNLNPDLQVPAWPPNAAPSQKQAPERQQQIAANPYCCGGPSTPATQEPCPKSAYSLDEKPKAPLKGILKNSTQPEMAAATAGRAPPGEEHPSTKVPVPNELRPVPQEKPPCYLPQPEDATMNRQEMEMGPIGPWATGRVDWGPLAGLTGTRPVVDKYSITRYSEGEWRKHNKDMLDMAMTETHRANL